MSNDILEKFNQAKQEAIENPPKKKRGCGACKKKKNEITELPPVEFTEEPVYVYDDEDIVKAYYEMVRVGGVKEESKVFISGVYKQITGGEEFIFGNCIDCKNTQYRKFRNYILYKLKKRI
jgi:hypothetical protein